MGALYSQCFYKLICVCAQTSLTLSVSLPLPSLRITAKKDQEGAPRLALLGEYQHPVLPQPQTKSQLLHSVHANQWAQITPLHSAS